jgi:hypothetical protein
MVVPDGIETGPQSHPPADDGYDWLDLRTNVGRVQGALNANSQQRYLNELGETQRLNRMDIQARRGPAGGFNEAPLVARDGSVPTHVFRGMSEEDFQASQKRGFIQSDGRGAIDPEWEGTNAGTDAGTAYSYLPREAPGRIVKIKASQSDGWFASDVDNYARTRQPIPWDRVESHTSPINKTQFNYLRDGL